MMVLSRIAAIAACVCVANAADVYPSTYPYENEPIQMPDIPMPNRDWTFEDSDPGGYAAIGLWCDMNDHDFSERGYSMCNDCGVCMAHLVYSYGIAPILPIESWNCTAKGETS